MRQSPVPPFVLPRPRGRGAAKRGAMSSRRRSRFVRSVATSLLLATLGSTFGELAHAAETTRSMVRLSPSFTTANIAEWNEPSRAPRCQTIDCVLKQMQADRTLRIKGDFGRFMGKVREFDADSLSGFTVDDEWAAPAPSQATAWSEVERVEMRVSDTAAAATGGALIGGLLGALISLPLAAAATAPYAFFGAQPDYTPAVLAGVAVGGLLGFAIGAGATAHSQHWVPLYARP